MTHIRKLGPASLFATEAFESFNAVIRAKSVHSNRQAPLRDIARAFAQGNRIRHLLSGGCFMYAPPLSDTASEPSNLVSSPSCRVPFSREKADWRTAGLGPLSLVNKSNMVTEYLGIEKRREGPDHSPGAVDLTLCLPE